MNPKPVLLNRRLPFYTPSTLNSKPQAFLLVFPVRKIRKNFYKKEKSRGLFSGEVTRAIFEGTEAMKRRLGRGLDSLISGPAQVLGAEENQEAQLVEVRVEAIQPNPFQPRQEIDEQTLEELAQSIRQHGVLQPLLVRRVGEVWQLVAGERRLAAAKRAGLETVPCRVLELEDRQVFEVAIEENLKRKDLNVLEKAQAFREYLERFGSTIEELAQRLSLDRSTVSNMIRLLDLAEPVKQALREEKISNGHARALLSLPAEQQVALCQRIQKEGLSVRKTEAAVRALLKAEQSKDTVPFPSREKPAPTNHVLSLEQLLRDMLGVKVQIVLKTADSGKIVIPFASNEEFERILKTLRRAA